MHISDADEIPDPQSMRDALAHNYNGIRVVVFDKMNSFVYNFRCRVRPGQSDYVGQMMQVKTLRQFGMQAFRTPMVCKTIGPYANCTQEVYDIKKKRCAESCAWHLSWFGGLEAFQIKSVSIAEARYRDLTIEEAKTIYDDKLAKCGYNDSVVRPLPQVMRDFIDRGIGPSLLSTLIPGLQS